MTDRVSNALLIKIIEGTPSLVKSPIQVPKPSSNQALVRVSHAAQNSTDGILTCYFPGHMTVILLTQEAVQSFDSNEFTDGSVLGCDFIGEVETAGSDVSKVKEGDIIAGLIWGGEIKGLGGYSEYTLADEQLCFKLPPSVTREEAVTVPLAACTAFLALFSERCLNIDMKQGPDISVLIWGGSSPIGRYAIQIAAVYKFRIITTCGPRSSDLIKSLGAHHVLNYYDEDVIARVQKLVPNLEYAFDTVGSPSSSATVSRALAGRGGNLCTVRRGKLDVAPRTKVTAVSVWGAFLQEHRSSEICFAPSVNNHELAAKFFDILPKWLEDGILKPDNPRVLMGGLDAVQHGFEVDRPGRPLGCKIVYEI